MAAAELAVGRMSNSSFSSKEKNVLGEDKPDIRLLTEDIQSLRYKGNHLYTNEMVLRNWTCENYPEVEVSGKRQSFSKYLIVNGISNASRSMSSQG